MYFELKMMDKIYEELDDAKTEIDKLRAETRAKAQLLESLKRSYNKQLDRIQEISLELEKNQRRRRMKYLLQSKCLKISSRV